MWFFQSDFFSGDNVTLHTNQSGVEPLTLAISLLVVWASSHLLGPHQLTEISHQLTFKIPTLIQQDLFGQPIVNNEPAP